MRIVHVITRGDDIGGAQVHLLALASRLASDGHDVLVVVGVPGAFTEHLDGHGIRWVSLPALRREIDPVGDVRAVRELVRVILDYAPDIVACHSSKAGIVGRIAAWRAKVPSIFTAHGWAFTEGVSERKRALYRFLERRVSRLTTTIICVSDYDRDLAVDAGIPATKLVTIHNGVPDLDGPISPMPGNVGLKAVMVGRFDIPKDQQLLVRAASMIDGVEIHFVGDGPNLPTVRALATELSIEDRCHFHGYQRDVNPFLRDSHVFCLISDYEGFPISTVEAMRMGRATIVSRVGGAVEAVVEDVTGITVARGSEEELYLALKRLDDDEHLRSSMGCAGRQRYLAEFTFDEMYTRTLDVYRAAASRA